MPPDVAGTGLRVNPASRIHRAVKRTASARHRDDIDDMRDFMRMTLEFGAEVVSAGDGVDALGALARERVHLVLCDLRMPRMDGYEFLRELERRDGPRHVPVIAVSAFASSADHLRTAAAGFDGHLDKPFADADLLALWGGPGATRYRACRSLALARRLAFELRHALPLSVVRRRCFRCAARP